MEPSEKRNVMAIIALVLAFFIPPIGLILGIIALVQVSKSKEKGMVVAIIAITLSVVMSIVYFVTISALLLVLIQSTTTGMLDSIEYQQETISCTADVSVDVVNDRVCLSDGEVAFTLENSGYKNIVGWELRLIGTEGFTSAEQDDSFDVGYVKVVKFSFEDIGDATLIQLQPQIQGLEEKVSCSALNLLWTTEDLAKFQDCDAVTWDD